MTTGITVALCIGQIAASAVGLARSLTELVPLAVEAVRLAFRTGVAAVNAKSDIEAQIVDDQTWALGLSLASGLAEADNIDRVNVNLVREHIEKCHDESYQVCRV